MDEIQIKDQTPKNDIIFKILFGNAKDTGLLINFLNAALPSDNPIVSVNVEPTELTPMLVGKKGVRLDISATTSDNQIINIEMQKDDRHDIEARSLFYWAKLFAAQAEVGDYCIELRRAVCINILNFQLFRKDKEFWHKFGLREDTTGEFMNDLMRIHFFEIPKARGLALGDPIVDWLNFIDDPYSEKVEPLYKKYDVFKEAKIKYEKAITDPQTQELLRIQAKAEMDYNNEMYHARLEGREEGREQEKYDSAKRFLDMGLPIEKVAQGTGLSVAEIKNLK